MFIKQYNYILYFYKKIMIIYICFQNNIILTV